MLACHVGVSRWSVARDCVTLVSHSGVAFGLCHTGLSCQRLPLPFPLLTPTLNQQPQTPNIQQSLPAKPTKPKKTGTVTSPPPQKKQTLAAGYTLTKKNHMQRVRLRQELARWWARWCGTLVRHVGVARWCGTSVSHWCVVLVRHIGGVPRGFVRCGGCGCGTRRGTGATSRGFSRPFPPTGPRPFRPKGRCLTTIIAPSKNTRG